jgi:hypothetical protein
VNIRDVYRGCFLAGGLLLFFSFFLDFYYVEIYIRGEMMSSWVYQPLLGWYTDVGGSTNSIYQPGEASEIPISLTLIYIGIIVLSLFGLLFRDIEKKSFNKGKNYLYGVIFLLILNAFYVFGYPVVYLFPRGYCFPFFEIHTFSNGEVMLTKLYYIGPGYVLQLVGFLLIFPWVLFQYYLIMHFESQDKSSDTVIKQLLEKRIRVIDFDKLIATENTRIEFNLGNEDFSEETSYGVKNYE